ncbi:MAG: hypothetical protein GXZ07_05350 [Firmicutes bacterium]|nr:hypothetical protein [Bacillota bacterium]
MELEKYILAIITTEPGKVSGGGAPVFISQTKEEQDKIATILARATEGVIHDLENGVYLLVKH